MNDLVIYNSTNRVTQYYGGSHHGIDLGYSKNEDKNVVYANSLGTIVEIVDKYNNDKNAKGAKSWGNYVYIKHPNGYYSRYAHLKKGSISVKKNQLVDSSTPIGIIGDSGHAFGRHLHYEVSTGYSSKKRINPLPYLTKKIYTDTYITGKYEILVSKAIRKEHEIANNIVLVKECMAKIKPKLTSKKPNDKAFLKVGATIDITDTYTDKTGRIWGKLTNTWIVIQNKDGTPQARIING